MNIQQNVSYLCMKRECVSLLYEDYKALHGNTFIDGLYEKMMVLPCEPPIPFESSELIK